MNPLSLSGERSAIQVNEFVRSVYNWMFIGLCITGLVSFYVSGNKAVMQFLVQHRMVFFMLLIAELALVISIIGRLNRMSGATATSLFILYSALNGVTLSFIFLAYANATIVSAFFICAGTFLACSIYGWTTKKDLTSVGSFFIMGLFGIIIASLVNMFINSSALHYMIGYIGVFVFVGLTAYDTQKIKEMAYTQPDGLEGDVVRKGAIIGALRLYLDFINLFLMLLRVMGGGRN